MTGILSDTHSRCEVNSLVVENQTVTLGMVFWYVGIVDVRQECQDIVDTVDLPADLAVKYGPWIETFPLDLRGIQYNDPYLDLI